MDRYVQRTKSPNVSPVKRKREEEQAAAEAYVQTQTTPHQTAQLREYSPTKRARPAWSVKGKEKDEEEEEENDEEEDEVQVISEVRASSHSSPSKQTTLPTSTPPTSPTKVLGLPPGVTAKWTDEGLKGMEAVRLVDGGLLRHHPQFLDPDEATALFETLMSEINWLQSDINVYGRTYKSPRMQCWMADSTVSASTYLKTSPTPWSEDMLALRTRLENLLCCRFDYLLLNLYRDGNDYISFHADREAIPRGKGVIASLSLGAVRRFVLKHALTGAKLEYPTLPGSLIVMDGRTQETWKHGVPKQSKVTQPRINLTFRIS